MVILNNMIPVDYNKMKKILWNRIDKKLIKILDDIFYKLNEKNQKKYISYIYNNMKKDFYEILNENHFIDRSMNYNFCNHIYKSGKYEGQICCAKIFIKPDEKQKYLCSRHCRKYETKPRNYTKYNIRCKYVKNNGIQCKHKCAKNKLYCYVHNKFNENENKTYINYTQKEKAVNKLKLLRKIYYDNIYRKKNKKINNYKIKNNNMFFLKEIENNIISNHIDFYKTIYTNKYKFIEHNIT